MIRTLAVCMLAALVFAASTTAAPPTLLTVGHVGDHATATWSLPSGVVSVAIEVATSQSVDSQGYFVADNVVDTAVLNDNDTSWTGTLDLDPGTYYVHLSGQDMSCSSCEGIEWTPVKSFAISSGGTTTTTTTGTGTTTTTTTTRTTTTPTTTTPGSTTPGSTTTTTTTTTPTTRPPTIHHGPNTRPRIETLTVMRHGAAGEAVVRACDDAPGVLSVRVTARNASALRATRATITADADGCWPYLVGFKLPRGPGHVAVQVRVADAAGLVSKPALRRLAKAS